MTLKQKFYLVCLILMQAISFLAFMLGFSSIRTIPSRNASLDELPTKINNISINPKDVYHQHIDKIILMVIDGLRYDFVVGDNSENNMPYVHSLVNKSDHCLLKVRVETPTVTMPRIKALMTGNIPGFLDVIHNIKTYEVIEDNILRQARKNGFSTIFYGDETWVNLFPHEFKRNETTSSFYVNDFYEVDKNVTRNLMRELNSSDWDIMILHYLGLDHIGHVEGPQSTYIRPKLNEMDAIISRIYKYFIQTGENVVLLVCGDHGMRDSGGHGGSSTEEILVPFLFLNHGCDTNLRNADINQIDLTTLICVLLGLPIPATNLGKLNYKLIKNLDPLTKLYAMHYSSYCLKQIFDSYGLDNYTNPDFLTNLRKAENLFEMWIKSGFTNDMEDLSIHYYFEAQKFMSEKMVELNVNFNFYVMLISVLLLSQIWWMLFRKSQLHYNKQRSLMSLSFFFLLLIINYVLCNYVSVSSFMCPKDMISKLMTSLLLAIVSFSLFLVKPLKNRFKVLLVADIPLLILFLVHLLSYASSSYIEEEHQFWYFLLSTTCIYLIISKRAYGVIAILIANRFLRKLNQTGNKWAFVPDIGDWLNEEQNMTLLLSIYLSGQLAIIYWYLKNISGKHVKKWGLLPEKFFFIAEILIITKYKFAIGNLKLPGVLSSQSRGIIEVQLFWICLTFQLLLYIVSFNYRNLKKEYMANLMDIFLIVMLELFSLLHRPHNIVLIPAMLFCLDVLDNYFRKNEYYLMVLYQSLGMAFYFYQGNSNGLATIDITAGFVGLEGFSITISGFYVFLNTFSSIILSNILLLRTIFHSVKNEELLCSAHSSSVISYKEVEYYWFTNFFCCSYILFYIILLTFQRYHLFVWTVFAPKLLYMGCELLLYGIILLTVFIFEVFHFIVANCLNYEFNSISFYKRTIN